MAALPIIEHDRLVRDHPHGGRRHADPRAVDQAVLPLQHLACARARPRPAVRQRARPCQPAPPRRAGQRAQARLRRQPHAFRPYRLPSRIPRPLRASRRGRTSSPIPRNEWTLADRYATDEMFDGVPEGWDAAKYRIPPAPAGRILAHGDVVDLGDRAFEVIHTPGHSPGGIALYEQKTGILLSGDIVYDGPLIDDAYHSLVDGLCRHARADARACRVGRAWRPFPELRADPLSPAHRRVSGVEAQARLPPLGIRPCTSGFYGNRSPAARSSRRRHWRMPCAGTAPVRFRNRSPAAVTTPNSLASRSATAAALSPAKGWRT